MPSLISSSCNFYTRLAFLRPVLRRRCLRGQYEGKGALVLMQRGRAAESHRRIADNSSSEMSPTLMAAPLYVETAASAATLWKGRPSSHCAFKNNLAFPFSLRWTSCDAASASLVKGREKGPWKFSLSQRQRGPDEGFRAASFIPSEKAPTWVAAISPRGAAMECTFSLSLSLFYNRDDNERFGQRSADVSFLPNEAPDNRARIKRPLWSSCTRFYLWLPLFFSLFFSPLKFAYNKWASGELWWRAGSASSSSPVFAGKTSIKPHFVAGVYFQWLASLKNTRSRSSTWQSL